jgi:alanine racemase
VHNLSHSPSTFARIDLGALAHNVTQVRACIAPSCEILAVVKANAYGHGSVPVTRALERLHVTRFGVASVEEGMTLRAAGIEAPVLVMGAVTTRDFPELIAWRLTPVLYRTDLVQQFSAALGNLPTAPSPYPVHLKIDTGMGRLGLSKDELRDVAAAPAFRSQLSLEGVMSHLADADNPDPTYTEGQIKEFDAAVAQLATRAQQPPLIHLANSAGILMYRTAHYRLVRPGIMLYGYHTLDRMAGSISLQPILAWHTTIAHLRALQPGQCVSYNRTFVARRASRIAVLPVGYADGYNRLLSNRGMVLIGGRRAPVIGRVCMDMLMVDVTDCPAAKVGDEVVLIGRQGQEAISASEMAGWLQTIPYEVLCAIGPRVPRLYDPPSPS